MINENITYYIPHSKIEVFRSKKQKTIRQISGDVRGRLLLLAFLPQSDDRQISKMHKPFVDTEMVSTTHAIFAINLAAISYHKKPQKTIETSV